MLNVGLLVVSTSERCPSCSIPHLLIGLFIFFFFFLVLYIFSILIPCQMNNGWQRWSSSLWVLSGIWSLYVCFLASCSPTCPLLLLSGLLESCLRKLLPCPGHAHIINLSELPGGFWTVEYRQELAQGKGRIRKLGPDFISNMGNKEIVGFFGIKVLDKYFAFHGSVVTLVTTAGWLCSL